MDRQAKFAGDKNWVSFGKTGHWEAARQLVKSRFHPSMLGRKLVVNTRDAHDPQERMTSLEMEVALDFKLINPRQGA